LLHKNFTNTITCVLCNISMMCCNMVNVCLFPEIEQRSFLWKCFVTKSHQRRLSTKPMRMSRKLPPLTSRVAPITSHVTKTTNLPPCYRGKLGNIEQAKGNEAVNTKILLRFFSSNLPICLVYFHLVMPRHILNPCYAHYEHTRGIKAYVIYILIGMLCEVKSAKHVVS
jgi:hypothetical protein